MWRCLFSLLLSLIVVDSMMRRTVTKMLWSFSGEGPSARQTGHVGTEGDLYYSPYKQATLKAPPEAFGKEIDVPVFPHTSVLVPGGAEWLNVYEMRFRKLFYDVGERGLFAFTYAPPNANKCSLVGTLARIKERKMMSDGRAFLIVEGIRPYYHVSFHQVEPYVKGRVQPFSDFVSNPTLARSLEQEIFTQIRVNYKMAQALYPDRNFNFSPQLLANRPPTVNFGISGRVVDITPPDVEVARQSAFTYAVIDMLQVSAPTKVALLQKPLLEKRMKQLLKILKEGGKYLYNELLMKKQMSPEQLEMIRLTVEKTSPEDELLQSQDKFEPWRVADSLVDGSLVMKAMPM
jgi:hypothetical protein